MFRGVILVLVAVFGGQLQLKPAWSLCAGVFGDQGVCRPGKTRKYRAKHEKNEYNLGCPRCGLAGGWHYLNDLIFLSGTKIINYITHFWYDLALKQFRFSLVSREAKKTR